jgi:hypothetical protein
MAGLLKLRCQDIMKLLNGALPSLLECLEDEVNKLDPQIVDEELLREVREELRRKFPKFVRSLALETRMGT